MGSEIAKTDSKSHLVFIGAANHIEIEIDTAFVYYCQAFQEGDFTWSGGEKVETVDSLRQESRTEEVTTIYWDPAVLG